MDSIYWYSDYQKLKELPIEQATVRIIVSAQYTFMDGEVGYESLEDLLSVWKPDWDTFYFNTGHDFKKEIEENRERYDSVCYYVVAIQMVEYNKVAWGIYDDFSGYKTSAKVNS